MLLLTIPLIHSSRIISGEKKMKIAYTLLLCITILFIGCNNENSNSKKKWVKFNLIDSVKNKSVINEPYLPLHSGYFINEYNPFSPDPIFNYIWNNPQANDSLQIYYLRPIEVISNQENSFKNIESLISGDGEVLIKGEGSIMFDFGVENAAWLEFDSPNLSGDVTMSISEYNKPAIVNLGAQNHIKTKKPEKYGNTYRLELNNMLYEGVRFGWINVEQFDKPWSITNVRLVCQTKPVNYTGGFNSNIEMFNKIWYTGAYGVKLNLMQDYFGAILMERSDRHSWTGDAHTSQAAALVAFNNYEFIKKNIHSTASDDNNIPAYSLYWILSVLDYYNYTGDSKLVEEYLTNIDKKIDFGLEVYMKRLPLNFMGSDERLGAVFENADCDQGHYTYQMLFLQTCNQLSIALQILDKNKLATKYKNIYQTKIRELKQDRLWWDEYGMHALANSINAGFISEEEKDIFFYKEFYEPLHLADYSPFNMYFIVKALAKMNKHDQALAAIKRVWGGQIELGATSFWELYRPDWNDIISPNDPVPNCQSGYTSLCHPWGGGVTKWLTEEIVGIKPTSPGFETFSIIPHLGRTFKKIKGEVLTLKGKISVSIDLNNGEMNVEIPKNSIATIGIPKVERNILEIVVNDEILWNGNILTSTVIKSHSEDKNFIYLNSVTQGKYNFRIKYMGTTPAFKNRPLKYEAQFIGVDSLSGINWHGKYGEAGSIFFNFLAKGKHLQIPSNLIDSVFIRYPLKNYKKEGKQVANIFDIVDVAHDVYLSEQIDTENKIQVEYDGKIIDGFGALSTNNPNVCQQTFYIDIHSAYAIKPYQVALFFKDWNKGGKQQAIEMFDLQTKKIIAPTKLIKNFEKGIYLIYKYDKPVRFRINHVQGDNAVLNAILFD